MSPISSIVFVIIAVVLQFSILWPLNLKEEQSVFYIVIVDVILILVLIFKVRSLVKILKGLAVPVLVNQLSALFLTCAYIFQYWQEGVNVLVNVNLLLIFGCILFAFSPMLIGFSPIFYYVIEGRFK